MKHYRDGYIIAKENEIVSENDITKMNQTVKENLSKYSKYNPEEPSQSAPLYANRIRTWEVLGEEPECEVLYIGEGIEYFSFSCTDKIKKIYIPSSVKEIRKSISSDSKISDLNNIYFEVSGTNPYYASENGSLYSKNFSKLIHFYSESGTKINSKCNEISKMCGLIVTPEIDLNSIKILRKKSLVYIGTEDFQIPKNVELLDDGFLIYTKTNKVILPKSVKYVGDVKNYYFTVEKENKYFSSDINGYLYSANGKTFLQGKSDGTLKVNNGCEEIFLSMCECVFLELPETVNKITGIQTWTIKYIVNQNNKYFSVFENSLYTKDFSELVSLHVDSIVHIHPDCKKVRPGALGKSDGLGKNRIQFEKFEKINFPDCLKNDEEFKRIMKYIV